MMMSDARYSALVGDMETNLDSQIQAVFADARPKALASVGFLARFAFSPIWSIVLTLVTPIARLAIRFALNYLSRMTLGEVADLLTLTRDRNAYRAPASKLTRPHDNS